MRTEDEIREIQRMTRIKELFNNKSGIYQIKSICTDMVYIGKTINLWTRMIVHNNRLLNNNHSCTRLQELFNIHGKEDLYFSVLEWCPEEYLLEREKYYVNNSTCKVLNMNNVKSDFKLIFTE